MRSSTQAPLKLRKGDPCPRCAKEILAVEIVLSLKAVRLCQVRHEDSVCFSVLGGGRGTKLHAIVGGGLRSFAGFPVYVFLERRER